MLRGPPSTVMRKVVTGSAATGNVCPVYVERLPCSRAPYPIGAGGEWALARLHVDGRQIVTTTLPPG